MYLPNKEYEINCCNDEAMWPLSGIKTIEYCIIIVSTVWIDRLYTLGQFVFPFQTS